ncbi:MFS transporter [uncultured Roseivirga sp.]|uniref:MFS transporter n=1 Tax=uncultured Roseivirga sp. TaxID=543088 RepID=UPI0030D86CF5|tara:strand:- start:9484 stop:10731 length:1248 start_codon:yes stop_codon:yes gene_type:complete
MKNFIQRIPESNRHPRETFRLHLSIGLERISYYGISGTIVYYILNHIEAMSDTEIASIFGWFTLCVLLSKAIGGLLGDFVLGNKNALIIGGVVEALGAFSLCFGSIYSLYVGLFLISLGSGMFYINIIAEFGKHYRLTSKLLDAGFSIFIIATNIAAAIGAIMLSLNSFDYIGIFIFSGILIIVSTLIYANSKSRQDKDSLVPETIISSTYKKPFLTVFLLIPLFWGIREFIYPGIDTLNLHFFRNSDSGLNLPSIQAIESIFLFPLIIIASIAWTYFYVAQMKKLTIAFALAMVSVIGLLLIAESLTTENWLLLLSPFFLISISDAIVFPLTYSILTKHSPVKYLATFIGATAIPIIILSQINSLLVPNLNLSSTFTFQIGAIGFGLISIFLIWLYFKKKIAPSPSSNKSENII